MRKREREIIESVEVDGIAAEGKAIAHINGKVLFIPFAVPGDIADILILGKRKSYMEGNIYKMITPSNLRVEPFCSHYGVCGGCKWQSLPYPLQLEYKQQQVIDQLTRIGKLELPEITPILGSEKTQLYRNKLEFTFSDKRWVESMTEADNLDDKDKMGLGFHITGMFDKVLDIKRCYLQAEPSNAIRLFIKEYALKNNISFFNLREQTGLLRNMVVRTTTTGQVMLIVVFSKDEKEVREALLDVVINKFATLTSVNYVINNKKNDAITDLPVINYYGKDAIYETMEDLKFKIGPKSFFQTNSEQAYRLYSIVRDFAGLSGNETVYDLYTGTGTIALFLAHEASKIVGIEYVQEAIDDALVNAQENNISNCSFFAGDMKDLLNKEFIEQNGAPDVIILDPPRAGIHPDVAKVIVEARPYKIVYVSCNPASQARDLALMAEHYSITKIQPVDMFPHTQHLENVVKLELKK